MNPIDTSGIKPTARIETDRSGNGARVGAGSADASARGQASRVLADDTVELTDTASRLSDLRAEVAKASGIDLQRVEAIKERIANGSYQVDAERVADALVKLERDLL
jgi:negative regulator of flagellin synthesis FlgM